MKQPTLPTKLNRKIGQAMHDWSMLEDGDRVLIGVSGGIDSLVTAWVLQIWRSKAPIDYAIQAVYVDHGYWSDEQGGESPAANIERQMRRWDIDFSKVEAWQAKDNKEPCCFVCARNRRSQLFELARHRGCAKLALGHHKDDLVETFFINALYSGNISTMLPKQELFAGRLSLIRILAYLDKDEVIELGRIAGFEPVKNYCPLAEDSKREKIRSILAHLYAEIPEAKGSLFAALGNVRSGYML
jgi:tRNA 2-thiocytidine biosynthesis protein TtcA